MSQSIKSCACCPSIYEANISSAFLQNKKDPVRRKCKWFRLTQHGLVPWWQVSPVAVLPCWTRDFCFFLWSTTTEFDASIETWSKISHRNSSIILHNGSSTKHIIERALISQNGVHIKIEPSLEMKLSQMIAISKHPHQVNLTIDPLADIRPWYPWLISCNPNIYCCRSFR